MILSGFNEGGGQRERTGQDMTVEQLTELLHPGLFACAAVLSLLGKAGLAA